MKATITMAAPVLTTPAIVAATPSLLTTYTLPVNTERTAYCKMCSALGRPHSDWSNVEDWDGERQNEEEREKSRQHEVKELKELKQKPITDSYYLPIPQYTPSSTGDTLTPALMDTLVPAPEQEE